MEGRSAKPMVGKKGQSSSTRSRPRLVYDEPHIFRVKSQRALSHLQQHREFLPCAACTKQARRRRRSTPKRPHSSYAIALQRRSSSPPPSNQRPKTATTDAQHHHRKKPARSPPTPADLDRLSRPKTVSCEQTSTNCNWSNFIRKKSKYAINTPYAMCDLSYLQESAENRPPFANYGGGYIDKQCGQKRTFNSLAVHQLKHHELDEQRAIDQLRERRLRLQADNYFREMDELKTREQEARDRAARSSTEYRDNYRPPQDYGDDRY